MKYSLSKKVCKGLSLTIFLVLMVSVISAITIYSGETVELDLGQEYDYYSIVGNTTEISLEVISHGNNVTLTFNKYNEGDTFELIFFDIEQEVIHHYSSGGSGGTRTIYRDNNITKTKLVNQTILRDAEVQEKEIIIEVEKIPWGIIIVMGILLLITFILWVRKEFKEPDTYSDERRYKQNE